MSVAGLILIVDDDRATREMLAAYLGSHGYRTVDAEDGGLGRDAR